MSQVNSPIDPYVQLGGIQETEVLNPHMNILMEVFHNKVNTESARRKVFVLAMRFSEIVHLLQTVQVDGLYDDDFGARCTLDFTQMDYSLKGDACVSIQMRVEVGLNADKSSLSFKLYNPKTRVFDSKGVAELDRPELDKILAWLEEKLSCVMKQHNLAPLCCRMNLRQMYGYAGTDDCHTNTVDLQIVSQDEHSAKTKGQRRLYTNCPIRAEVLETTLETGEVVYVRKIPRD